MDECVTDEDVQAVTVSGRADRRILCAADRDGDDHLSSGSTVVPVPVRPLSAISFCLTLQPHLPQRRQTVGRITLPVTAFRIKKLNDQKSGLDRCI